MTYLIYIFSFLILISIIVFIHELGHFSFARLFGVRVLDFSIGFGRSIKSWETKSKLFLILEFFLWRVCKNEWRRNFKQTKMK